MEMYLGVCTKLRSLFRLCIPFPPLRLRLTERLLQCGLPLPLRIREQFLCLLHSQRLVFFRLVFSLLDLLNRIFRHHFLTAFLHLHSAPPAVLEISVAACRAAPNGAA